MRVAAKRDANEASIVRALRKAGAVVTMLSQKGVPDLLVAFRNQWTLIEVKMPLGARGGKSHRELTDDQVAWWNRNKEKCGRLILVRDERQALWAIGACDEATRGLND